MATGQCVDINKGGFAGSDPALVLNGLCCKFASFYPYLSHITDKNIANYLSTIKTAIPYHVYWVLTKHPELIIDKLDMFIMLLFNIQKTALSKSTNGKVRIQLGDQNKELLKILRHYFYYCSNINAAGMLVPPGSLVATPPPSGTGGTGGSGLPPPQSPKKELAQIKFINPDLPIAKEYNEQLDNLVEKLKTLVEKKNGENSLLTKLHEHIFGLEKHLDKMKTEESKLNLTLPKPDYIKLSSVWFITDTQGDETKPAPAKGQEELVKTIQTYQEQVQTSTRIDAPKLKELMDIAINAFKYIPKITDQSVTFKIQDHFENNRKTPKEIGIDPDRLVKDIKLIYAEDVIVETRKFLANQIAPLENQQIRQEFVDKLKKILSVEADIEVRARICNNISDLLFQPQYNLNDFQKRDLQERYGNCAAIRQKTQQQSKKQGPGKQKPQTLAQRLAGFKPKKNPGS